MKKFLFLLMLVAFNANAARSELVSEFDKWQFFYYNDGSEKVCFITTKPLLEEGKYTSRGDVFMTITSRPNDESFDVFSINGGYQYKNGEKITLKIGNTTIDKIFADKDKAWSFESETDKEIIAAMKRGSKAILDAVNAQGIATKDTYSLDGFSAAYRAMSSRCRKI